jgi:hypothetical protein
MPGSVPARIMSVNCIHGIRGVLNFDSPAAGVELGTIPAGSFVKSVTAHVITAFNAGTTNTVDVGTTADPDGFAATAGVLPAATGVKLNLTGAQSGDTLTADTVVIAKYTQAGTAATAGKVQILVEFYPHVT